MHSKTYLDTLKIICKSPYLSDTGKLRALDILEINRAHENKDYPFPEGIPDIQEKVLLLKDIGYYLLNSYNKI